MAKNKPKQQPWSGEEAPKPEEGVQAEAPAEEGEGDESAEEESEVEEGDEAEESADESETGEGADEEDPAADPEPAKEPEVSAAIKPAKKSKKKDDSLTGDGIKAHGKLVEGDHLPNEVINRVSQGVKLADAIAEYNQKRD